VLGAVVCIIGYLLVTREGEVTINIAFVGVGIENATGGIGLIALGLAMVFMPFVLRAFGQQRHTWLGLTMLIGVTLVLGLSILASSDTAEPGASNKPPDVAITSLQDGEQAPMMMDTVRGTSKNLSPGQEIWLVVVVQGSGRFYPQEGPISVQADGDWASPSVFLGVKNDSGKKFHILAVLATQEAGNAFAKHLEEGGQTDNYPGLQRLPAGAVEYDRVTVTRE
jgi:hypothetical protein